MKGFVGEEGEGVGFLGVFGDAELGGGEEFDAHGVHPACNQSDHKRVVSAATGDDELVDFCLRKDEPVQSINNAACGERGCGSDDVVRFGAVLATEGEDFIDIRAPVIFAAGGFGRWKFEVRVPPEFVEKSGNITTFHGQPAAFVKPLAAVGEMGDEGVDEHVGGAGVEGEDLGGLGIGGDDGDVGDAAEIQRDAAEIGVAIEDVVDVGN